MLALATDGLLLLVLFGIHTFLGGAVLGCLV